MIQSIDNAKTPIIATRAKYIPLYRNSEAQKKNSELIIYDINSELENTPDKQKDKQKDYASDTDET